ncbi:MAG: asparagine synthase (glutamine-hydrolyzing) [Pseudomonadota bacterium]
MCGIAALFMDHTELSAHYLQAMADVITHRGPDGEGYALWQNNQLSFFAGASTPFVEKSLLNYLPQRRLEKGQSGWQWGLAHRRLAIIDLSPTGHQPMATADSRYVITYNGEVYNYLELRAELEGLGYTFRGHSDTEIILAAYVHWGKECLTRFNGMFAFVIVDCIEQRVFAARDRFGVKPLYMMRTSGGVAFASEIKQFTVLPEWQSNIAWQATYDFLQAGITDHTNATLFAGVEQIRGGHYILTSIQNLKTAQAQQWYTLQRNFSYENISLEAAAEQFSEMFADAVRLRLRADVPIGTALSGGLDSSAIVCEVSAQLLSLGKGAQKSFSVCSLIKRYDERSFIDIVTQATNVDAYHTYPDTQTLLKELPQLVWHQDEPFAGTSIFAEWEVYKLARHQGVKVTLDGHGADEMLCGYHAFFWIYMNELLASGNIGAWIDELRALQSVHGYKFTAAFRSQLVSAVPNRWITPLRNFMRNENAGGSLLACSLSDLAYTNDPQERFRPLWNNVSEENIRQVTQTSVPVQLHWADRDSMAHSVESRLPFLDYRLVEFVVSCPTSAKLSQGTTKRLLRKGMAHRLPPQIAQRQDKMGFVTPEQVWLCEQQGQYFSNWIDERRALAQKILSVSSLNRAKRILLGQERYNRFAWRVLSLVMWSERFSVRGI